MDTTQGVGGDKALFIQSLVEAHTQEQQAQDFYEGEYDEDEYNIGGQYYRKIELV